MQKSFCFFIIVCQALIMTACSPVSTQERTPTGQPVGLTPQASTAPTHMATSAQPSLATSTVFPTFTPVVGISEEQDRLIPPIPPHNVRAKQMQGYVEVTWQGTGVDIDTHYVVHRRPAGSEEWEVIANVLTVGENTGEYNYQDLTASTVVSPQYAISTVNRYGKESMLSDIASPE